MNNLIIFYTIIFFLFINSSSAQNYFPSELGIKYQSYYSYYHGGTGYYSKKWFSHMIEKDSIINGKRFIKFGQNSSGPYAANNLYHYDTTEQKLFMKVPGNDTIRLAVDFNAAAGDSFISYLRENKPAYFYSEGIINYQGHITYKIRVSLTEYHWSHGEEYYWKDSLGLFFVYKSSVNWAEQYHLISYYRICSAILAGTLYDPVILNITSLSPLQNRLVTEFPFIMNGDYNSTLVPPGGGTLLPLIDSFYVKVVHLREADTLGTYIYPFNSSKLAFINLIPQAGDKLLVRAYVSDTTIFNNNDTFPDSGYAEILVLPNLPVEFISFTAAEIKRGVLLNWSTATETNNLGFEIERSVTDKWITIGFISGHGTSTEIYNYTFTDDLSEFKNISKAGYRLKQVDYNGSYEYSDEVEVVLTPGEFILNQNYPNPFNPFTIIKYSIPERSFVSLIIYDVMGNEIAKPVNEEKQTGTYSYSFNGSELASGVYFYKLIAGNKSELKKMLLIK